MSKYKFQNKNIFFSDRSDTNVNGSALFKGSKFMFKMGNLQIPKQVNMMKLILVVFLLQYKIINYFLLLSARDHGDVFPKPESCLNISGHKF